MTVNCSSPARISGALNVAISSPTGRLRSGPPVPAPLFRLGSGSLGGEPLPDARTPPAQIGEFATLLADLLRQAGADGQQPASWNRGLLLCIAERYREPTACSLAEEGYKVFVAEDTKQAVERMRENQVDVLVLDPEFDLAEQGLAFVLREVNVRRPPERRRLFLVLLSPSVRTMDAHAAFLQNVNLVVNYNDVGEIARLLEIVIREFNGLYKDFNNALHLPAL